MPEEAEPQKRHPLPISLNGFLRAYQVVGFLREELGVTRLAVHGESIGGVAAASAARHCQVDLLILDRTFSSLSAIGQRMLGGWTKWAIWGFTGWKADVSSDYLACRCYKVGKGHRFVLLGGGEGAINCSRM